MPDADRPPAEVLLEQGPACHWIVNQQGIFEQVFGHTLPIFGKPPADLSGQPVANVIEASALPIWLERFNRAFSGESLTLREQRDGRSWCISVFPLRLKAGAAHAGCLMREITDYIKADHNVRRAVLAALHAQETQRARTAQFLHNVVGQNMAALGLRLDLVRMDLNGHAAAQGHLGEIQVLLESIMEQVRNYSYELNPSTVERVGLRSALDRLGARLRERFRGSVNIDLDPAIAFPPNAATTLYRIAEEAAENAVQHSGCSLIEIAVQSSQHGAWMEVRDNGRGFDPADLEEMERGVGLLSMEHHANEAGLRLTISSSRQFGTVVRAVVPAPQGGQPC